MSTNAEWMDLIDVKGRLRRLPKAERTALVLDPAALARGYHRLRETAPHRGQGYLSKNRTGVTASGDASNRIEEHLAVALFNRGALMLPEESLALVDYQFPLKAVRADGGVGKIDLLGLRHDGTLAIFELKVADSAEDRRIALLEGLIYAAIVEANIDTIAKEFRESRGQEIGGGRPHIVIAAPPGYWSNDRLFPDLGAFHQLVRETAVAVETQILTCSVDDADDLELGLNGRPPRVRGHAYLSPLEECTPHRVLSLTHSYDLYLQEQSRRFWSYRRAAFAGEDHVFEPGAQGGVRPPVFRAEHAERNLIVPPGSSEVAASIVSRIPREARHRHFASMRSSQALAQSVFGTLTTLGRLNVLAAIEAEDGYPAFFAAADEFSIEFEQAVDTLGELPGRQTSVDAMFSGPARVAVEMKLAESGFGRCSRPSLRPDAANFGRDHCDGSYTRQRDRATRCSLSERGIGYWRYVPQLFDWSAEIDHRPCPLDLTYQLARNVMAACVRERGAIEIERAHALLVYDAQNPAFRPGGVADAQWWIAVRALRYPRLLRRVSWQRIMAHLEQVGAFDWLVRGMDEKYGI